MSNLGEMITNWYIDLVEYLYPCQKWPHERRRVMQMNVSDTEARMQAE